jgi:hypothetical protein
VLCPIRLPLALVVYDRCVGTKGEAALEELEAALQRAFPDAGRIPPLRRLGAGFARRVYESRDGVVFGVAQTDRAADGVRRARQLLPVIAHRLPVAVPEIRWWADALPEAPYGVSGYPRIPGNPIDPGTLVADSPSALIDGLAASLNALHGVELQQPAEAGVPNLDPEPEADRACGAVASELDPPSAGLLDTWHMKAPRVVRRALCHGDLWYENLLVGSPGELAGILDWDEMRIADPAWEFAAIHSLGLPVLKSVASAYLRRTGSDTSLLHRSRWYLVLRELLGLEWAILHDRRERADALIKLRRALVVFQVEKTAESIGR